MSVRQNRGYLALVVAVGLFVGLLAAAGVNRVIEKPAVAAGLSGKHTICHRTASVTNPYRKITVSKNAVFANATGALESGVSRHPNHDDYPFKSSDLDGDGFLHDEAAYSALLAAASDVDGDGTANSADNNFNGVGTITKNGSNDIVSIRVREVDNVYRAGWTYPSNQKKWGDIIPPLNLDDTKPWLNYSLGGPGRTLFSTGCRAMTAAEFYTIETTQGGKSPKEVLADLDEQGANEDKALLSELGGTFSSLCPDSNTDGICDSAPNLGLLNSVSADTTPYTASNGNPVMNGVCTVGQTNFRAEFRYAPSGQLGTQSETVVNKGTFTLPAGTDSQTFSHELTGLTGGATYDYRLVCITDPSSTDFIAELDGGIESFTVGQAPPLPMVITAPSIGPITAGSALPALTGWTQNPTAANSVAATGVACSVVGNSYNVSSLPGTTHFIECTNGSAAGYTISYTNSSFTVTGSMVITAPTITVTAGSTLPALTGWTQNPIAGVGVPAASNVTCSVLGNSYSTSSAAGSQHTIRCANGTAPSYSITYIDSQFTVDPANVPVVTAPTTTVAKSGPPAKTSGGGSGGPPATDPRTNDNEPIENNVNVQVGPNLPGGGSGGGGGGSIRIAPTGNDPGLELLDANIDDPEYELEITRSGTDYNKPQTWVEDGFGDECWKIEPGGSSYVLPTPPAPPSGKSGAVYSAVKVKAGSLTSDDPNFQVNTLFLDPAPGSMVWPDSNKDGVYNPGGRTGDKEISHVILCVKFGGVSTPSTTAAPGATTTTRAPSTTAAPGATTTTRAPSTTAAPGATTTTRAPSTTAAPGATTTTRAPSTTAAPGTTVTPGATTAPPAIPTTSVPDTSGEIQVDIRRRQGLPTTTSSVADGPRNRRITLTVTNGFKQSQLILDVDLDRFVLSGGNVPLPQLPKTGSDSDQPIQMALAAVAFGAFLVVVRRRLRKI